MNLDKFKHQHTDILRSIATLRALAHAGVEANATTIAQGIVAMSGTIKLHLAVEDQVLYPALQRGGNADLARMGRQYQSEMASIASAYDAFARRWNTAEQVRRDAEGFRSEANVVLRRVFERMQREDHDFYPRIEEEETADCH
ncbi:hemerythrin HHE cation-binding domain-containing protein [Acidovorax sp. KKS102]|uniref:hemerythrin domain-containing protein n=1 Tax=Acidovorax sp. KKS102 TaxID=358220 RepID=UPI00028B37F6|nr:hemerythrin domain-containing protein [Acidovorax sp. KKS102]AFU43914.1 hemerythrin HHE cation-binding domain-containing protein [Acidovorax sp. KKS102]